MLLQDFVGCYWHFIWGKTSQETWKFPCSGDLQVKNPQDFGINSVNVMYKLI